MTWKVEADLHGRWSGAVGTVLVVVSLTWLCWPVWGSVTVPSRTQARAEAPWIMAALVCGLVALTVALWIDSGRRFDALSTVGSVVLLDTLVRAVLNPAAAGVEFVHALVMVGGMASGPAAGFLAGASSAIVSTIVVGEPASTLPAQAIVWGVIGVLGGLLWRLPPRAAWGWSLPLALVAGVFSGLLLNLIGWAQEPGTTLDSFAAGLPVGEVLERWWTYTAQTSLIHDLTRSVTTMLLLAVFGYPCLLALRGTGRGASRRGLKPPGRHSARPQATDPTATGRIRPVSDAAVARRGDRERLDRWWNQGES